MKKITLVLSMLGAMIFAQAQTTYSLTETSDRDNTIYEDEAALSNGGGNAMITGTKACDTTTEFSRRALVYFPLDFECTPTSVESAKLYLFIKKMPAWAYPSDSVPVSVHRLTSDWGENTSTVATKQGWGTQAQYPDATWAYSKYLYSIWNNAGGDYVSTASDCMYVYDTLSSGDPILFTGSGITNDVSNWADGTYPNYGWILIGDESNDSTGVIFHTREASNANYRPQLVITYTCSSSKSGEVTTEVIDGEIIYVDDITVYPNPVEDVLNVTLNSDAGSTLYLYSSAGVQVETTTVAGTSAEINVSGLASGVYTLVVKNEYGVFSKQILKK